MPCRRWACSPPNSRIEDTSVRRRFRGQRKSAQIWGAGGMKLHNIAHTKGQRRAVNLGLVRSRGFYSLVNKGEQRYTRLLQPATLTSSRAAAIPEARGLTLRRQSTYTTRSGARYVRVSEHQPLEPRATELCRTQPLPLASQDEVASAHVHCLLFDLFPVASRPQYVE